MAEPCFSRHSRSLCWGRSRGPAQARLFASASPLSGSHGLWPSACCSRLHVVISLVHVVVATKCVPLTGSLHARPGHWRLLCGGRQRRVWHPRGLAAGGRPALPANLTRRPAHGAACVLFFCRERLVAERRVTALEREQWHGQLWRVSNHVALGADKLSSSRCCSTLAAHREPSRQAARLVYNLLAECWGVLFAWAREALAC